VNKLPDWELATAYLLGGISPISLGVVGKWRNPAAPPGQGIVPDPQNRYEIAVADSRVDELRASPVHVRALRAGVPLREGGDGAAVEYLDNPLCWG
jgi:hypothetical protein